MASPTTAEFIAAWHAMDTSTEMAEHFGISRIAIRVRAAWLRQKGVPLPYHDFTNAKYREQQKRRVHARRQEFANIANSCANRQEAAEYLGITVESYSAMASVYRKLGYDIQKFDHPWLEWED